MATKSPGIYFHEIDNTHFTNPKSAAKTTLAVVGYAKKGPIGVPTLINSWKEYRDTFGEPIEDKYSGLAAYTFISAGGSVLFVRVADETASTSSYIVKNRIMAKNGYISMSRTEDLTQAEYDKSEIYSFKLANSQTDNKNWKYFFVKVPANAKRFEIQSILTQIANQMDETPAKWEGIVTNNITKGLYAFNIKNGEKNISEKDFFIKVPENQIPAVLVDNIIKRLNTGTNAIAEIEVQPTPAYSGEINPNDEGFDYKSLIKGTKSFYIVKNGKETKITVPLSVGEESQLTLKDIASKISEVTTRLLGISVFAVQGVRSESNSKLVFVSTQPDPEESFTIRSITKPGDTPVAQDEEGNYEDLFMYQNEGNPEFTNKDFGVNTAAETCFLNVTKYKFVSAEPVSSVATDFKVEFDDALTGLVLSTSAKGSKQKIEFVNGAYDKNVDLSLLKNVFIKTYKIGGQEKTNIEVSRQQRKIRFTGTGLDSPVLDRVREDVFTGGEGKPFKELLDLMVNPDSESLNGYDEPVAGNEAIPASLKDMVVISSREKGSGTNNIKVAFYDVPTGVETYRKDLEIYVNNVLREKFEGISLDYADVENRFDTIINKTPENGGSEFINIEIKKNDFEDPDVQIPEGNREYYIGRMNMPDDIEKDPDTPISFFDLYDYTTGTDGIPEYGSGLFEKAMEAGRSALANKELYDFHILIAPDSLTQETQAAQIKLCEDRGDAITIVDPPFGLSKKGVIDWHNGKGYGRNVAIDSTYAAVYWPWCQIADTSTGKPTFPWVMPSIIMAAQYVKVDNTAGNHMAPAGDVNGQLAAIDIEKNPQYPNALDRDELYVEYNRINPISKFNGGRIVAYGEKTTQRTNSTLTKIHTRRMLIGIKKQCREALKGYIFMPNTVEYLGKISSNIGAILENYRAKGGVSYYKVVCDETNNPIEVRQQDIINVDVAIVPEGTIEQINISLTLNKSQETVTD